jgi:uncharacterized protein YggE
LPNSIVRVAVISAALGVAPALSFAQGAQSPMPPQIVTSGAGQARVTPDRATISIGVQSRAPTAAAAAADNARRQRAILDTLRAIGLASEDLSTNNYNVSPEMQYTPNGTVPPRVIAYTVTNTVRVELRKLEDIGRVIDAALAKGANEISSLQFRSTQADSGRRVALAAAVLTAKADAEVLAQAAGGSLGSLLEVSSTSVAPPRMFDVALRATAAKASTPIEPGEQTVSATVTVRWAFVPGR